MNHFNTLYLCIACAEEIAKTVIAAEAHQFHLPSPYDLYQRKGEEVYCCANACVNLPLAHMKPCYARQTSEAALKKTG